MRRQFESQFIFAIVLGLLSLSGCGRLLSAEGHLRDSMWADGEDVDYVAPQTSLSQAGQIDLPELAADDEEAEVDLRPPHMQPRNMEYLSQLYRAVVLMRDDVIRLTVRAEQKGAAGRAAFDPKLRTFHTSVRLINRYVVQFYDADTQEWEALKVKINNELNAARDALREASQAIDQVKEEGYLIET